MSWRGGREISGNGGRRVAKDGRGNVERLLREMVALRVPDRR